MVERFFAEITRKRIRRGVFKSVDELKQAIMDYLDNHNGHPEPYIWTKTATEIFSKVARANQVLETLRVLREWRGKTQLYISHKTNVGQGYISDLENGRRKGTTAALKKIANVLKVPLDLIV
jgi:hypothetical protein